MDKNTNLGNQILGIFDEIVEIFTEKVLRMSLEDMAELYSKKVDKLILEQEDKNNYNFVGGQFKIYYFDEDYFRISISLYFMDENKEWKKTATKSEPQKMKYLNQEAVQRLVKEKTVVFEIEKPQRTKASKAAKVEEG